MIDFHFCATPNCWKVGLMLEEIEQPYRVRPYNILAGEHLTPEFGRINPNHKVPVIVDESPAGGGSPITVFESGAILFYLAEKSGRFLPSDIRKRMVTMQWLTWQVAGLGPMLGQANHFVRYCPEQYPYSINRYVKEGRRLLNVMEYRLRESAYLGGEEYSIADMAAWPWVKTIFAIGFDLHDWKQLARWEQKIAARPATVRFFSKPETAIDPTHLQQSRRLTDEQWSNVYGENMLKATELPG